MAKHADAAQEELSESSRADTSPAPCADTGEDSPGSPTGGTSRDDNADARTVSDQPDDADAGDASIEDETDDASQNADDSSEDAVSDDKRITPVRLAAVSGLVMVVALGALLGWFGFRDYQAQQARHQRDLLVQVGRQGALNLTTIDWHHADADVQRILESATGQFYDDFSQRSKPFVDVVKKAQSTSVGTITEAGLESQSGDEAQVLVAVSVKTSNLGAAEQDPRHWRMRITVQKVGGGAKVSNVGFVP